MNRTLPIRLRHEFKLIRLSEATVIVQSVTPNKIFSRGTHSQSQFTRKSSWDCTLLGEKACPVMFSR